MNTVKRRLLPIIFAVLAALVAVSVAATTEEAHAVDWPVAVNEDNFPDPVWRNWVNAGFAGGDGELKATEATFVLSVDVSNMGITDLTGIEYFENITSLKCSNNSLTALDLSANQVLEDLHCSNNSLTDLDLSNNTALTYITCNNNLLTSLNLGTNAVLEYLYCENNLLTSLDLSNDVALVYLCCEENKLTSLDMGNNAALQTLLCSNNDLASLTVGGKASLMKLYCNFNKLTTLDVSGNTALADLSCSNNKLTTLDVSGNMALRFLFCNENDLTSLNTGNNTALEALYCDRNELTSLDVSGNSNLTVLDCFNNKLAFLDVGSNSKLIVLGRQNNELLFIKGMIDGAIGNAEKWQGQTVSIPVIPTGSGEYVSESSWLPPDAAHSLDITSPGVSYNPTTGIFTTNEFGATGFKALLEGQVYLTGTIEFVEPKTFTVTFIDWNSEVLYGQVVAPGENAIAPQDPSRFGYVFIGWDKEFSDVQENLIVQALYEPVPVESNGTTEGNETTEGNGTPVPTKSADDTKLVRTSDSSTFLATFAAGFLLVAGLTLAASAVHSKRKG